MVTYEALMRFAKTLEGQVLETSARRKRFTVEIVQNDLLYTPLETKKTRKNNRASIEKVLTEFNKTKSYMPSHYSKLTANASYLMRLLEIMTSERTRSTK